MHKKAYFFLQNVIPEEWFEYIYYIKTTLLEWQEGDYFVYLQHLL